MKLQKIMYDYVYVVIGGFLSAVDLGLFIVPLGSYNGEVIGMVQIIRIVSVQYAHMDFGQLDAAGIINFLMNVSLFILAYRNISRKFLVKALLCVLTQTIAFTVVMIPSTPILDDVLVVCLVDDLVCGFGIGLALRSSGSGDGLDVLGICFTKESSDFDVGRLSNIINILIFGVCVIPFNVATTIYSIIYTTYMYLVVDKTHYQNISMTAMTFIKEEEVQESTTEEMGRGIIYWREAGAYTKTDTYIFIMIISKYEVTQLKEIIYKINPRALVIFNESMSTSGNPERRL